MSFTGHKFKLFNLGLLLSILLAGAGCESGGGGSRHDHDSIDFGNNNRDVYVALGDSITGDINNGVVPYPPRLAGMLQKTVINEGRGGETSGGGAGRVGSVLSRRKPGYLLILYGANDLIHGRTHDSTINNLRHIIRSAKNNKTVPVIATLTPMVGRYRIWAAGVERLNNRIRALAQEENVWLVDLEREFGNDASYMSVDGLHPGESGCQLIALAFYDELR